MVNEHDLALCSRVIEKCQQQHWYGGDEHNTAHFSQRDARYETCVDVQGNTIVGDNDPDDHPRKFELAYAPATQEELAATEQELGFPLPAFLRLLYTRIANGGFGPGYGLIGAIGGFDEAGNIVDMYHSHTARAQLVDLEQYGDISLSLELPSSAWPRFMLYLCDWGEARVSCLDCVTGRVFLVDMGERYRRFILEVEAASLQDWWERWLAELPRQKTVFDPFLDPDDLP